MRDLLDKRVGVVVTAALCLSILAFAPAAQAARPKCFGKRATILGSQRNDRLRGTPKADVIVGRGGDDVITGRDGRDLLCGGKGSDLLRGRRGNDKLKSGRANDGNSGGAGNDVINGGPGRFDDARWLNSPAGINASLRTGRATGHGTDVLRNLEQLLGGPFDDRLIGDNAGNTLPGNGGNDTVLAKGGDDFVSGGDGDDTIKGGQGFDFLDHYFIIADFGQGPGPVTVDLVAGTVTGQGSDLISNIEGANGTPGNDTLIGNDENNNFVQTFEGDDNIQGAGGNDLIDGGDGNDTLDGGPGVDLVGHLDHTVAVTINLSTGTAVGDGSDVLLGFEAVLGSFDNDTITGDANANLLMGAPGDDAINGLDGDDELLGEGFGFPPGDGDDTLDGGDGNDACDGETEANCETDPSMDLSPLAATARGYGNRLAPVK
jgi:Ca2+-binding RTX toxin-like protein